MNKYKMAMVWDLATKGCERMGWDYFFVGLDAQLCAAQYYLDDIIEEIGENTSTGKYWARLDGKIQKMRDELKA